MVPAAVRQVPGRERAKLGIRAIGGVSRAFHVFFGFGSCCRFYPSCSQYSQTAIGRYGWLKGSYLSVSRILRCRPGVAGGFDPVPVASVLKNGPSK